MNLNKSDFTPSGDLMPQHPGRTRRLVILGALALSAIAVAPVAGASQQSRGHSHGDDHVRAHDERGHDREHRSLTVQTWALTSDYRQDAGAYDSVGCHGLTSPTTLSERSCVAYYSGEVTSTGGLVGTQRFRLATWFERDGMYHYEGEPVFRGSVPGCGTGTFRFRETEGTIDILHTNPADGSTPGFNKWEIIPGTATGTLRGRLLGGHGVNNWKAYGMNAEPNTAQGDFGKGRFTGTITCRVES